MMYELKRKIGHTVNLHIGSLIPFQKMEEIGDLAKITKFLKEQTYSLAPKN